jgi:hypothetical protein
MRDEFGQAIKIGLDEPCDFVFGQIAIDTKYRIGSGDSGTLKKFRHNGQLLKERGYEPILLILREDNLLTALSACRNGGWGIYVGDETFEFIHTHTQFNLQAYLAEKAGAYEVLQDFE